MAAGRPITLPEPWRTLALRNGGTLLLCKRYRWSHRALYSWVYNTRTPTHLAHRANIPQAFIDAGLPVPRRFASLTDAP